MNLKTKYDNSDIVWVVNGRTGSIVSRQIQGVRTQFIDGYQKTIYSFLKDKCDPNLQYHDHLGFDPITTEDIAKMYFWLPEEKCFDSKEELINSL